ncbi:hypothetical protein MMC25_000298 [Agyrium rufum]|nr:hypothetical protein [Agyrium rufum]
MATNGSEVPIGESAQWDEARLQSALDRLHNMHIQLRQLRETIPTLVQPMHTHHASPAHLYKAMSWNAITATKSVQLFTHYMRDAKTQSIMQKTKESQNQEPNNIRSWAITDHADWLEKRVEDDVKELTLDEIDLKQTIVSTFDAEEVRAAIATFKQRHRHVEVKVDEAAKTINIRSSSSASIPFRINFPAGQEQGKKFLVENVMDAKLHKTVVASIAEDPRASEDLDYTLDMLPSYDDVMKRHCYLCNELMLNNQWPTVRKQRKAKKPDGSFEMVWEALHGACEPYYKET